MVTESEMLFLYKAKRRYSQFSTASLIYGTVRLFISNKVEVNRSHLKPDLLDFGE